jgi:hypothetical protein
LRDPLSNEVSIPNTQAPPRQTSIGLARFTESASSVTELSQPVVVVQALSSVPTSGLSARW